MAAPSTSDALIASSLVARAHSPDTAQTIYRDKILHRPLLLRPTSPDPKLNARSKRQHDRLVKSRSKTCSSSTKPKPLSAKQKRALQIHTIPKSQQKYTIYEPLHELWCSYIRDILGLTTGRTFVDANFAGPLLVSADYHGAMVQVVRSRCASRVGLKGIVVKDTKFTFEIVTRRDEVKIVPKEQTVFRVEVPFAGKEEGESGKKGGEERKPLAFELFGNRLMTRAPERATKKVKAHDVDF